MREILHRFDEVIMNSIQALPSWVHTPLLLVTNIGQPLTIVALTVGLMIWALMFGYNRLVVSGGIILGVIILASVLKVVLRRVRPDSEYVHSMLIATFSFPSGHATAATIGFGFIAYAAASVLPQPLGWITAIFFIIFALLVCLSRIYLGAHHPSDVLGGIVLGMLGLGVVIFVVRPFS